MSSDADITISRVLACKTKRLEFFTVDEPVAVVPFHRVVIGDYTNLESYETGLHRGVTVGMIPITLRVLERAPGNPIIGVGIIPRSKIFPHILESWKSMAPGAQSITKLTAAWDKLTPGIWCVTRYSAGGVDDDYCYWSLDTRKSEDPSLRFEEPGVTWEFWT